MDVLEVFLIADFRRADHQPAGRSGGLPPIVMQRQEAQGKAQVASRRNRALDAGTPRAAQAKRDAGASGSGVNDEGRQKIQAVRRL